MKRSPSHSSTALPFYEFAAGLLPIVNAIRATGATTLEAITRALNDRGVRSARGATWHVSSATTCHC
jgi:hypothetical protein